MKKFDLSSVKNNTKTFDNVSDKSKDTFKRFEMIMTNSFGLNSSSDIYP